MCSMRGGPTTKAKQKMHRGVVVDEPATACRWLVGRVGSITSAEHSSMLDHPAPGRPRDAVIERRPTINSKENFRNCTEHQGAVISKSTSIVTQRDVKSLGLAFRLCSMLFF